MNEEKENEEGLEISEAPIEEFSLFDWNPRKTGKKKYRKLKDNIEKHGLQEPVKVRDTGFGKEIWDGEHRYKIAKELDIDEIPYVNYGPLSEMETKVKRADVIMEAGEIDPEILYEEYKRLKDEEKSIKEISNTFGRSTQNVRQGIKAIEEREEGSGKLVDDEKADQLSIWNWYEISKLPEDMKEDAIEKRISGELGLQEIKELDKEHLKRDSESSEEEDEGKDMTDNVEKLGSKYDDKTNKNTTTSTTSGTTSTSTTSKSTKDKTSTSKRKKKVKRSRQVPKTVKLYMKRDLYDCLKGATEDDQSVASLILEISEKWAKRNENFNGGD